jgi:hypothetical protein
MFEKKPPYNPVTDHVPGVNEEMRAEELKSALPLGDPLPQKPTKELSDKITKSYLGGHLKITR